MRIAWTALILNYSITPLLVMICSQFMRVVISVFVDKEGLISIQRIVVMDVTWHRILTKDRKEVGSTNDSLHINDLSH
jgi:hypothetical protein